jgi:hypothetical protein
MKWALAVIGLAGLLAGCGLNVQSADLFLLTRTGNNSRLTLLVSDGGTIRCNARPARRLSDHLLIEARYLANALDGDAKAKLMIAAAPNSVYRYRISLQGGTISFPDTAAASGKFPALARAELFTVEAAQQACRLSG